jgi:hypothetical protein
MMEPILAQKGAQLCDFVCQAMAAPEDADGFALERKARLSKGKGKNRSTLNMVRPQHRRLTLPEYLVGG